MQISAIILSGGKSSRMGTDKSLLGIEGKTLLQRAVDVCLRVCSPLFISSNNPDHKHFNFPVVPDEIPDCGPIGGIYSCLKQSETEWNFVLSVDAAFVPSEFVQFLISEIDDSEAVIPVHNKGKEPLIAMYHKNCLPEIEKMMKLGNYKMHHLLNSLNTKLVHSQNWLEKYPDLFRNLNQPEDF